MRQSASVVVAWLRLDLRRRWRSLLVLMLLIAIAGATVMGSLAGARRGASALQRLQERSLPATSAILANTPGFDWSKIRALPEVAALTTFVVDYGYRIDGRPADANAFPPADANVLRSIEKPVVYQGRIFDPTRDDEVVVTRQFVAKRHKGVGDTVLLELPSARQVAEQVDGTSGQPLTGPQLKMRIVGVIGSAWYADKPGASGQLLMSPGVVARHPANTVGDAKDPNNLGFVNALVRLRGGETAIAQLRADVARLTGRSDIDIWNLPDQYRAAQRDVDFESRSLAAFAAAAFAAAVFLVGQAIARYAAAGVAELQTMRALGMTPGQAIATAATAPTIAGVLGATFGGVGAYLISHWTPIGTAALLEPSPGLQIDWVVVGFGVATVAILVSAAAAAAAWLAVNAARREGAVRRSAVAAAVARGGFAVPVVVGARFALEAGRGRDAVPVRPALLGAVAGVLGILAAFTFSHGVSDAAAKPERFGQTFQVDSYVGINGQDFGPVDQLSAGTLADKDVTGLDDSRTAVASGSHGVDSVALYTYSESQKPLPVVVNSGRMPQAADEVLLAPHTMSAFKTRIGRRVTLTGNKHGQSYLVTGAGFVPEGIHNSYADGGWITPQGYDAIFTGFKFHVVLVALRPEARNANAAVVLGNLLAKINPDFENAFEISLPPAEVAQIKQLRALPVLLGTFLALLAVGAVGHALATAVRRRSHDLAVLRALGMTQWQSRWVTVTQATVVAVIGLVFGVPLGLAVGRSVWRAVADYTPIAYVPPLAVWALALVAPVALLIATLLSAWPGQRAARLRVATILRAE
ncbi:MAG: transporter permease [Mycobacterium sp.]|nr:transporter permease [Mycobacterium sp.]